MDTPTITVYADRRCPRCKKKGSVSESGVCLACIAKDLKERVMETKPDVLSTDERPLYCDLTPDELRERGDRLAVLLGQVSDDEETERERAKAAKIEIAEKESEAHWLAGIIRMRREERSVPVETRASGSQATEVRTDTGEVLRTRPMTDRERQQMLPRIGEDVKAASGD